MPGAQARQELQPARPRTPLPSGVDTEKASAEFKNGVLTVTLPKTQEAQSNVKKIEVKAN